MKKKAITLFSLLLTCTLAISAQNHTTCTNASYAFVGVQGGWQTTFTNYEAKKLATPIFAVQLGAMWTPFVGTRLHVEGLQNRTAANGAEYTFKYGTTNVDLMLNVTNFFRTNRVNNNWDLLLIGGMGLTYTREYERVFHAQKLNDLGHNLRIGLAADYNITPRWAVGLEVDLNNHADKFNAKLNNSNDWQLTAMMGLTYKFRCAAPQRAAIVAEPKPTPLPIPTPAPEPDTTTAPNPAPTPVVEEKAAPSAPLVAIAEEVQNVFFLLNSSVVRKSEESKIATIVRYMKAYPEAQVIITGYADADTGNAMINAYLSEKRVEAVYNALLKQGIAASRIQKLAMGDTVQPFKVNDLNRCVICVAKL